MTAPLPHSPWPERLALLLAVDAAAVVATIVDQWLVDAPVVALAVGAGLAALLFPASRRVAERVAAAAARYAGIPDTGEVIPGAGQ